MGSNHFKVLKITNYKCLSLKIDLYHSVKRYSREVRPRYFWYAPILISSILHFLPDILRVKISSQILLVFRLNMFFASLLLLHLSPTYYSIRRERQSRALNALIAGLQVPLPHLSIVAHWRSYSHS